MKFNLLVAELTIVFISVLFAIIIDHDVSRILWIVAAVLWGVRTIGSVVDIIMKYED